MRLTKTRVRDAPEKPRDADAAANPVPVQRGPWGARTAQGGAAWPGRGKASAGLKTGVAPVRDDAPGGGSWEPARIGSGRAGWKGRGNYAETIAGKGAAEDRPGRLAWRGARAEAVAAAGSSGGLIPSQTEAPGPPRRPHTRAAGPCTGVAAWERARTEGSLEGGQGPGQNFKIFTMYVFSL